MSHQPVTAAGYRQGGRSAASMKAELPAAVRFIAAADGKSAFRSVQSTGMRGGVQRSQTISVRRHGLRVSAVMSRNSPDL